MPNRTDESTVQERWEQSLASVTEIDLRETLRILGRRKWVIVATAVVLTALTAGALFLITPRYTASVEIAFDPKPTSMIDFSAAFTGAPQDEAALLSELEIIGSRRLAKRVIDKLDLYRDPEFNSTLREKSGVKVFLAGLAKKWLPEQPPEWLPEWVVGGGDGLASSSRYASGSAEDQLASLERKRVVDAFLREVKTAQQGRSRVVEVSFTSQDPFAATVIANTLADLYLVERLEGRLENVHRASNWLAERVIELRDTAEKSEHEVEEYRNTHGLLKGDRDTTLLVQQVSDLSTQLTEAKITLTEAEARLAQIRQLVSTRRGAVAAADVLDSPLIQKFREEEAILERKEAELKREFGPKHPLILNVKAEKWRFRQNIEAEVRKIVMSLENDVEVGRLREAAVRRDLEKMTERLAEANQAEVGLFSLEREAEARRLMLEKFQTSFMETNAQEDIESQIPDARIITSAALPEKPSFPNTKLVIAAGFAGSVLIGVLLAFAIERLDPGFRSGEQVERQLGVPVISLVPLLGRMQLGGETPETYALKKPGSAFGEAIRSLHTTMMLASSQQELRTVVVSSSEPDEGKTTVAISLAQLQARLGRRVLLVDTDFRLPSVAKRLGLHKAPGLMEFMAGNVSHAGVVQRHLESGADVIVSGEYTEAGFDFIASEKMEDLIKRWRQSYDLVVMDTAPLHVVSESRILSRYADGTVLVVRWGKTRREAVNYSRNMIADAGGRLFGVALSMVDTKRNADYGFGDSGFYYGKAQKYYRA